MVLIGLLLKSFRDNIKAQQFPNHVIRVSKQDLVKIQRIDFEYQTNSIDLTNSLVDLSKLEYLSKQTFI